MSAGVLALSVAVSMATAADAAAGPAVGLRPATLAQLTAAQSERLSRWLGRLAHEQQRKHSRHRHVTQALVFAWRDAQPATQMPFAAAPPADGRFTPLPPLHPQLLNLPPPRVAL